MKIWKTSLLTFLSFFAISATVLFSSCEQDACLDLKCDNGGACADGFCRCQVGYEGAECETPVAEKFLDVFIGERNCNGVSFPDTVIIFIDEYPNRVKMVQTSSIQDTLTGLVADDFNAEGYSVSFDEYTRDNYYRKSSAKLSGTNYEKIIISNLIKDNGESSHCIFFGVK